MTKAAESFQGALRFSCCFVCNGASHYLFTSLLPPRASPLFSSLGLVFPFVLFDLAEIPQEDLKVLQSSPPPDTRILSEAVWAAVVTSPAVDPTSLSDSVSLPFFLIRVSHFLFQPLASRYRFQAVTVCVCETRCCAAATVSCLWTGTHQHNR